MRSIRHVSGSSIDVRDPIATPSPSRSRTSSQRSVIGSCQGPLAVARPVGSKSRRAQSACGAWNVSRSALASESRSFASIDLARSVL